MTIANGIYGNLVVEAFTNVLAYNLGSDTIKLDLQSDTFTPNFNTMDEYADLTNIVTGTNWAGGYTLVSPSFTAASGYAKFDANDISVASTTVSGVEGCTLWDDTLTGDPLMVTVDFGATYATSTGTLAINWATEGIWRIKYDPSV